MNNFNKINSLIDSKEKLRSITLLFFIIIASLFEILSVGMVIPIISLLLDHRNFLNLIQNYLSQDNFLYLSSLDQTTFITIGLLIFAGIYFVKIFYLIFFNFFQFHFIYSIKTRISKNFFLNYISMPLLYHKSINTAELIRNINNNIGQFIYYLQMFITFIAELAVVIGISLLLFFLETKATIYIFFIFFIFSVLFYSLTKKRLKSWGEERQVKEKEIIKNIQESFGGIKEIKIFNKESFFFKKFYNEVFFAANLDRKQNIISNLPKYFFEVLAVVSLSLIIWISLYDSGSSFKEILPKIALFGAATFRLMPSFNRIISSKQILKFQQASINILYDENIKLNKELVLQSKKEKNFNFENLIFKNVSFKYPSSNNQVLENVDLDIKKGNSYGIGGKSGSGKSTLIDLMLGLIEPTKGKITINNNDNVKNLGKLWLDKITYVPQKIYLFDNSLKNNICLEEKDKIDKFRLSNAIRLSGLDELIEKLDYGIDTIVGERGEKLSGGQIQRIGIARALYNLSDIIILDEATNALDTSSETKILKNLFNIEGNKTIILISHKLSVLKNCNMIYEV